MSSTKDTAPYWMYLSHAYRKGLPQDGQKSIDAALTLSECTAETRNEQKPLIVATLDFDVVDHGLLPRRLFSDGITGADWLLSVKKFVDRSYISCEVGRDTVIPFVIKQGIRPWESDRGRVVYSTL